MGTVGAGVCGSAVDNTDWRKLGVVSVTEEARRVGRHWLCVNRAVVSVSLKE